jgi:hypothetical protein
VGRTAWNDEGRGHVKLYTTFAYSHVRHPRPTDMPRLAHTHNQASRLAAFQFSVANPLSPVAHPARIIRNYNPLPGQLSHAPPPPCTPCPGAGPQTVSLYVAHQPPLPLQQSELFSKRFLVRRIRCPALLCRVLPRRGLTRGVTPLFPSPFTNPPRNARPCNFSPPLPQPASTPVKPNPLENRASPGRWVPAGGADPPPRAARA